MSIQRVAEVLTFSRSKGGARLVMISIANHDGDGGAWPTIATIARETNMSERYVHENLRALQKAGELVVHLNRGGTADWRNDRRPNRYQIVLHHGVEESAPRLDDGVEVPTERGGGILPNGVQESSTQTIQEPSTKPPTDTASRFDDFWATYPRRIAKEDAKKAWGKAMKAGADPDQIIEAVKAWIPQWKRADERFTPHPATWLNRGGWEDELPGAAKRAAHATLDAVYAKIREEETL